MEELQKEKVQRIGASNLINDKPSTHLGSRFNRANLQYPINKARKRWGEKLFWAESKKSLHRNRGGIPATGERT